MNRAGKQTQTEHMDAALVKVLFIPVVAQC